MNDLQIGLVAVPLLITGIVQAVKNLSGLSGRPVRALALGLGVFFVGLDACLDQGFFTPQAALIIETGVYSLAGGLAAMGYYDLGKQFLGQPEPVISQVLEYRYAVDAAGMPLPPVGINPATFTNTLEEHGQ